MRGFLWIKRYRRIYISQALSNDSITTLHYNQHGTPDLCKHPDILKTIKVNWHIHRP